MEKIKISWLTGANFLDVDMPLLPKLSDRFQIRWIVIRQKGSWFDEQSIQSFIAKNNIDGVVLNMPGRLRSFGAFQVYRDAVRLMKEFCPDIFYVNYIGIPYLWPLISVSGIKKRKVIYPCHDYIDHVGVTNRKYYVWTKKLIFTRYRHFQFFSLFQQKLFLNDYKHGKDSFYAPLAMKDFGPPKVAKPNDGKVKFLFFGNIRENKGLEFLISAANSLYERYPGRFVVKIYGNCKNWDSYQSKIKHPECFDLQIRRIGNEEIADLFNSADYLMLPYRDVTQSVPLLIAYNYRLPAIASNHSGFLEYIEDGVTGYIHKNEDSQDLFMVMAKAVDNQNKYPYIKKKLCEFIEKNISLPRIISLYENGFFKVCNDNK